MRVLLGLLVGLTVGWLSWQALRDVLAAPVLARANHRGTVIPTGAGLVVTVAGLAAAAATALAAESGLVDAGLSQADTAVLTTVVGFALLGLVDDVVGWGGDGRGFRGHVAALARGRMTTGALKLVGGAALAVAASAPVSAGGLQLVGDAALVALAANLANQFDRAPGRALKVATLAFVLLAVPTGVPEALGGVAVAVGAGLVLLPADLGERLMLGDTGANAMGGVLGLGVVVATGPGTRLVVLVVVAALNLAGDLVSFSRVIDAVPVLRAVDRAGRRR
ncbi:MAG: hypothetical protein KY431_06035 [Actinobacteria bacterium]|nr:hypothetical protein [Actinomycetota bacterium]